MSAETYRLVRDIRVDDSYDVFVAGGGPAGASAAITAARLGLKVLLAEANGCMGGMGTSAYVTTFGPMGDGERPLVGGFCREMVENMHQRGFLGPGVTPDFWAKHYNRWIPFHPEGLKQLLDEKAAEAGVDVRYFTKVIDAETDGSRITGAVISNVEGYTFIKAKTFIDCTGDATLSALAGAECKVAGVDWTDLAPGTVCSLVGNMNWDDPAYGGTYEGIDEVKMRTRKELLPQAVEEGHFSEPFRFIPGMNKLGNRIANINAGHVYGMDGLDAESLSKGMVRGREVAREFVEFYRKYVPGCEDIELVATSPNMGVRDTRRIVGEFTLTIEDYQARRQFPDQVCVYNRPPDNHPTNSSPEEFERFKRDFEGVGKLDRGASVGIPYSILVPKGWENLWVAGRCHSSGNAVHGSIRAQSAAYMMGQAAATAAKQSIDTSQPACDLNTETLVQSLRGAGCYLPQESLSRQMTR
ncbi:FAD-dependent oxidoreductase [Oceanicola sp. D3]|uniref:FAD-dependent oxidoreductase n=1 Tax=Oceanicola sp. D3 TaxID=2587163 RepID=UPI00111FCFBE|nr:FAD-dependent oxidoreductase [Oceanicola sp. D3]QDC08618.1 FAD-dependent oxidoreductase [Oceanicola sp. D3]